MNNTTVAVPFLDLAQQHRNLEKELVKTFTAALREGRFIGGPNVECFESEFAAFCGVSHCIGVGSGTDALRFALLAAGIGKGDAVITVPNTFIATTEAISQAGATPVFVDIDEHTYNMDPARLIEYLETRCEIDHSTGKPVDRKTGCTVTCVVPVHIYGQTADMDTIQEIAASYNLAVVEDACQAHGAGYYSRKDNAWKKAGSMGLAAAFSFYPGKNLGACGEAGAVTTNNSEISDRIRMLRDHGQREKYYHQMEGYNGRLDAIQAGFLRVKLKFLEEWNDRRRAIARCYGNLLAGFDEFSVPFEPSWSKAVYHLYILRHSDRDRLKKHLDSMGFMTGLHYPLPLHLQAAYEGFGYRAGDFPAAENVAKEIISLPIYPELDYEMQRSVTDAITSFAP